MELTHSLSFSPPNPWAPFCTSTFTSTFLIAFLNVHIGEKIIPLPYIYILCTLMPQIIPLLALALVHMWYEESTPRVANLQEINHDDLPIFTG